MSSTPKTRSPQKLSQPTSPLSPRRQGRHPRTTLANINPAFDDESVSISKESSRNYNLKRKLSTSIKDVFPAGSTRKINGKVSPLHYTIRLSETLRQISSASDTVQQYEEAVSYLDDIRTIAKTKSGTVADLMETNMLTAIFGSNAIEKVGATEAVTYQLCREVFAGRMPDIEPRSDCEEERRYLELQGRDSSTQMIIRSRQEVVQHALAFKYMVNQLVFLDKPLTEEMIKITHQILLEGSEHEEVGGVYRTQGEACLNEIRQETDAEYEERCRQFKRYKPDRPLPPRNEIKEGSVFMRPGSVPIYMIQLVDNYNEDINTADTSGIMDPCELAAKYCALLVNIHPFEDGNGRLCRILMNTILLKYFGTMVDIGLDEEDRANYIATQKESLKTFTRQDYVEDIPVSQTTAHAKLGRVIAGRAIKALKRTKNKLSSF